MTELTVTTLLLIIKFGIAYFFITNTIQFFFVIYGGTKILKKMRNTSFSENRNLLTAAPPVSIIVPIYNEQDCIVRSLQNLLTMEYPNLEVIAINDGSTDNTLELLKNAFKLTKYPAAKSSPQIYTSDYFKHLTVIDKDRGGKSATLNCGLRHAKHKLVCTVDADSLLAPDALLKLAKPFVKDPEKTIAAGGVVRILNGSSTKNSRIDTAKLPRGIFEVLQIAEYVKSFFCGRAGWDRIDGTFVVSGAFAMFRKDILITAGGFSTDTVGEDIEVILRLHRFCGENGYKYKVAFVSDAMCWTDVPKSASSLIRQRDRWQRGLVEAFLSHKSMLFDSRFGNIGKFAMPYILLTDIIGPLAEIITYTAVVFGLFLGVINQEFFALFLLVSVGYGVGMNFIALWVEEKCFPRTEHHTDIFVMFAAAVLENVLFHPFLSMLRFVATMRYFGGKRGWNRVSIERKTLIQNEKYGTGE